MRRIVLWSLAFTVLLGGGAWAWGPLTHAAHLHETDSSQFSAAEWAAIQAAPDSFRLGTVMPDLRELANIDPDGWIGRVLSRGGVTLAKYVAPGISTHSVEFALDLVEAGRALPTSDSDRDSKLAFALGWLVHCVGDVIPQSTYTTKKMCQCGIPGMDSAEDLVEMSVDRLIYNHGYRSRRYGTHHPVRGQLEKATRTFKSHLAAFLHSVATSSRWNSRISLTDLEGNLDSYCQVVNWYSGNQTLQILDTVIHVLVDGILRVVNWVPGVGLLVPDLLLEVTYKDAPFYVQVGVEGASRMLAARDNATQSQEPWYRWTTINYHALLFGAQQWYNRLAVGRSANRDGLLIYDFAFRRPGSGARMDHAQSSIGEGQGVEAYFDMAAWRPVSHDIRLIVRRDIRRWFDKTVVRKTTRMRFSEQDILSGIRREVRVPFTFRKNQYRWSHRWRSYTRGFYVEAFLNRGFFFREEFSTKDTFLTRKIQGDRMYDRYPFSLRIVPGQKDLFTAHKGGFYEIGVGNVPVPKFLDRVSP
ncbi:MAG: hypothetical protein QF752_09060 [Planctomycetota bacterium]|nr:hypothetical protein [Planctomycetota bacterium]